MDLKHCALAIINICESIRAADGQPSIDPLVICVVSGSHVQELLKVPRCHLVLLHDFFGQLSLIEGGLSGLFSRWISLLCGCSSFNFNSGNGLLIDLFVFHLGDNFPEDAIQALAEVSHTSLVTTVVIDDLAEGSISHLDLFHLTAIHWGLNGAGWGCANAILQLGGSETVFTFETWD